MVDTFKYKLILSSHHLENLIPLFEAHEITDKIFATLTDLEILSIVNLKIGPMRQVKEALKVVLDYDLQNGPGSWIQSCIGDHNHNEESIGQSPSTSESSSIYESPPRTPFEMKKERFYGKSDDGNQRPGTPWVGVPWGEGIKSDHLIPLRSLDARHRDSLQITVKRLNFRAKDNNNIQEKTDSVLMPPPPKRVLQETPKSRRNVQTARKLSNGQVAAVVAHLTAKVKAATKGKVEKKNEKVDESKAKNGKNKSNLMEILQPPMKTRGQKAKNDENSAPKRKKPVKKGKNLRKPPKK